MQRLEVAELHFGGAGERELHYLPPLRRARDSRTEAWALADTGTSSELGTVPSNRGQIPLGIDALVPVSAAILVVVGFSLPFWVSEIDGVRSSDLDFSSDVGLSWPILGVAALAGVGAVDRWRGAIGGLAVAGGALAVWIGMLLCLIGTTELLDVSGYPITYGAGGVIWIAALIPALASLILGLAEANRGTKTHRASPGVGTAIGLGGLAWLAGALLPGDVDESLLGGPFISDVGRVSWVAAAAVALYLAATRRSPACLGLVLGQASAWSLLWSGSGDPASLVLVFEPWTVDVLFGLGITVAGTSAAVGMVQAGLAAGRGVPPGAAAPSLQFSALLGTVLVPLFGLAGFAG